VELAEDVAVDVGAVGAGAAAGAPSTVNVCATVAAARKALLPGWSASIVQLPFAWKLRTPPAPTVQTLAVADENPTASPESDVADSVGLLAYSCVPGFAKPIVWAAFGVTLFDAAEVALPRLFVAVNVKVYDRPFVSPPTVHGEPAQLTVGPTPPDAVAV
jgi:hypothetical protein